MASIPCAAYQASHIHAHLRRQNMRKRHDSADSTASDPTAIAPLPLVTEHATASIPTLTLRDRMDQVSHWVGDGFKRFRHPMPVVSTDVITRPTQTVERKPRSYSESAVCLPASSLPGTNQGTIDKPNT